MLNNPELNSYIEYRSGGVGKVVKKWDDGFLVQFANGGGCNHSVYAGVAAELVTDPQKIIDYDRDAAWTARRNARGILKGRIADSVESLVKLQDEQVHLLELELKETRQKLDKAKDALLRSCPCMPGSRDHCPACEALEDLVKPKPVPEEA